MVSKADIETITDLYSKNLSIPEICEKTKIARSIIRYHLLKYGILRSRAEAIRIAAKKGRLGGGLRGKKRVFTDSHRAAIKKAMIEFGIKNARGFSVKPNGYCEVTVGVNKGRRVHDVIMEAIMGRKLSYCEVVHHIDGNTTNNDPMNLKIMNQGDHLRYHRKQDDNLRKRDERGRYTSGRSDYERG